MIDIKELTVVDDDTMRVVERILETSGDLNKINVVWNSIFDDIERPFTFDRVKPSTFGKSSNGRTESRRLLHQSKHLVLASKIHTLREPVQSSCNTRV